MVPVETSRNGWRGMKENAGGGEFSMIYLICKNFCKCHNVPPPRTTIKKEIKMWYLYTMEFYSTIKKMKFCYLQVNGWN
jgi:hypothetical protein